MKYIVLLCDGMSDEQIPALGNKTVMEYANTPNFDAFATEGACGFIHTAPGGLYPGSDICNLSIFGFDPHKYYTGRSPLEAASIGVELGENDMAFRCNLVTLTDDGKVMDDFSAHHIGNQEALTALNRLREMFADDGIEFYAGVGYRNLMVMRNVDMDLNTTPPHDIMGQEVEQYLPTGKGAERIRDIMLRAKAVFNEDTGRANAAWFWGQGRRPMLPSYQERFGLKGAVIAAVDLLKGIGRTAGFDLISVPGATGFIDTNFKGKAEYAVRALETYDYVFVHVEAPDEAGHMGSLEEKIKAVENIDTLMLPILREGMEKIGDCRLLITPDHPTPVRLRTHVNQPVPAIIWGAGVKADSNTAYNENVTPSFVVEEGYKIAELFIQNPHIG